MKRIVFQALRKVFSPPKRAVIRDVFTELQISYQHWQGLRQIRQRSLSKPSKINLGSGPACKSGYLNIDLFPGADLTLDLRKGLPFESNCCEIIFSEHFFEHIDYPEPIRHLFSECLRVLQPGGLLRFSVPDTEWPLHEYCKGPTAPYFIICEENSWHPSYCTTRLEHINYHFRQDGQHRFAYDEETVRKLLEPLGFAEISRVTFDPALDSEHRRIGSLFISAQKPA